MKDNSTKKNKFKDWLPKILSVLASIILWFYVYDVKTTSEEITINDVPIDITNFSNLDGLDIISGKDLTVDVVIRGTKADVYNISAEDIYASVDMVGVDTAGNHKMDVDVVCLKKGVTIINKNVSRINVKVDRKISDVVPVEIVPLYTIEEQVYSMGSPVLSFDNVRISGPQDIVDSVVKAKGELNIGQVKNNVKTTVKLKLYDANGKVVDSPYLKMSEDVVTVDIPVYKSELKSVVPDFYDANFSYSYDVSPSDIIIKGDVLLVQNAKVVYTEPISDTLPSKIVKRLVLPAGVTAYYPNGEIVDSVVVTINEVIDLREPDVMSDDDIDDVTAN